MQQTSVPLKEYFDFKNQVAEEKIQSLKEVMDLKTAHLREVAELNWKLSERAINKAETAMGERMEASNNKFALLKEQSVEFASRFSTKEEIKAIQDQVSLLTKLVYIGIGGLMVLEFIIKYVAK